MIYATRNGGYGRKTLHELTDSQWKTVFSQVPGWRLIDEETAHQLVRQGIEHDTGLWIDDDGVVQYAEAEEAKAEGEIHSPPGRSAPSIGSTPRIGLTSDGAREPNNETINLG